VKSRARRRLRRLLAGAIGIWWAIAPSPAHAAEGQLEVIDLATTAHPNMSAVLAVPGSTRTAGLAASAFTVTENGRPATIETARLPHEGLEVVLVIDTSGSMRGEPMEAAKAAAIDFIGLMPDAVRIAVVGFGSRPLVSAGFSPPSAELARAVSDLAARGETALNDAVVTASGLFTPGAGRRALVLLSDGGDTASVASTGQATAQLQASGAAVFAVGLLTPETDLGALQGFAAASAGRLVPAADPVALRSLFEQIAADVVNQYRVTWTSATSGATTVTFTVVDGVDTYRAEAEVLYPAGAPPASAVPQASPPPGPLEPAIVESAAADTGSRSTWLVVGLGASFAALLTLGVLVLPTGPRVRRLAAEYEPSGHHISGAGQRAVDLADRLLASGERRSRLGAALDRAGVAAGPAQALAVAIGIAGAALVFGLAFGGPLVGVVMAALVWGFLWALLSVRTARRRARFMDQFEGTLQLMVGSLRSGYGVMQAIDTVALEADSPTSDEFTRVVRENRLGKDLTVALRDAAERVDNDDFRWVCDAIEINREIGGNLAEVLDHVAETLRARARLRRQVQALSAEGRLSAYILIGLPIVMFIWLKVSNPDYSAELTGTGAGRALIAVGIGLLVAGALWMRKIIRVTY
jgi:tight adherence protein B